MRMQGRGIVSRVIALLVVASIVAIRLFRQSKARQK